MGNHSSKTTKKKNNIFHCLCTSTYSSDEKSIDDIKTKNDQITSCCLVVENEQNSSIDLSFESNRSLANLINKFQLKFYLKDYLQRLKKSQQNQTFSQHFSSSTIIYPCNGIHHILIDHLHLFIISPPESILPNISRTTLNYSIIHEQLRAQCYFIPLNNILIEPFDNQQSNSSCIFISNDSYQTGLIRINSEIISKEFLPFIIHSSEENFINLSSKFIEKWFYTLILVNQTCVIAKQFLIGNHNYISCLFQQSNFSFENNLIFAVLRRSNHLISSNEIFTDAFSSDFLSNNEKFSSNYIHIDYEQYSFAFILSRWPKILIENYYTNSQRYSKRKWPCENQMKIIIEKSLLLIPIYSNDQWKINWDLIEEYLFQLMNSSCIFFYLLCQKFFARTYSQRKLIKHIFLNFCEKYDLPFSKNQMNILDLIRIFLEDLSEQIKMKFIPNYFNHQMNLLESNEDYQLWFDYIDRCLYEQIYFSSSSLSFIFNSTRSIICQYLFRFTEELFENFRRKQSEFYLNDTILIDFHKKFSNNDLLIEQQTIDLIQRNLTINFENNAELVHRCLNQIRKSQSSLIFHYIWTIYIQYLHTYYNVLWNL